MVERLCGNRGVILLLLFVTMLSGSVLYAEIPGQCPAKDTPGTIVMTADSGCYTGTDPGHGIRPEERSGAIKNTPSPESLSGSYVTFDAANGDACWLPGTVHDFAFTAQSYTNDWEYVYNVWLKFPSDWSVSNVQVIGTPSCSGGGTWGTFSWSYQAGTNEINIYHPRYQTTTDSCAATYLVTVTTGAATPSALVSWYWDGDGYNNAPHWPCSSDNYTPAGQTACDEMVNPQASIPACSLSGVYLAVTPSSQTACPGATVTYPFTIYNYTGASATFDIAVAGNSWTVNAPATAGPVADSGTATFNVTHTIDAGAASGATDTPTVTATDQVTPANTASTSFTTTASSSAFWNTVNSSAPSWAGYGYPCRGCTARNASGQWTTYLIGDMSESSLSGFWAYNHSTNAWSQPAPTGLPADRWSPGWAYDSATNLCYMTGGASAPGGGTYNTAYVYDPVANAFSALPSFTSIRDFHNSWVGTIDGTKYLVIGGGVNNSGTYLSSTQCLNLSTNTWQTENTVMPAYSFGARWGAAEGLMTPATGNQFWVAAGADGSGSLTGTAYYFDDLDNAWHAGGAMSTPVYRTNGAVSGGNFYVLGGSTGGFTPSALVQQYDGGTWSTLDNMPHSRMDLVTGVGANDYIWVVDGYGDTAASYVDYLGMCVSACPTISIGPATLPDGTIGLAYSQTIAANGGSAPYSYSVTSGTLPTGLTMTAGGVVSGTPTTAGAYTFMVTATDSDGCTGTITYTINVSFGFDWTYYDDLGRSQVCINSATGYYAWYVLTSPPVTGTYIGQATITPTVWGYNVIEKEKPSGIRLYIYKTYNRASGSFQKPPLKTASGLIDTDLTDNPACP